MTFRKPFDLHQIRHIVLDPLSMKHQGSCLCGHVQYEIAFLGTEVADYCHCRQCQRAGGAPVLAWVQVPPAHFRVNTGQAKPFASSPHSTRWFCPDCGSPLYMTDNAGRSIGVTLATLDNPNAIHPTVHGWVKERPNWFDITDSLPCYPESPPYDET